MSSSLLLKIRVALQSGDRESAINLRQNEQSNNHSSEMESTYINTHRRAAENINTGLWPMKPAPFIHIFVVRGRQRCLERVGSQLVMMFKGVLYGEATVHQTNHVSKGADAQSLGQWMSRMAEAIKHHPEWDIMLIHPCD